MLTDELQRGLEFLLCDGKGSGQLLQRLGAHLLERRQHLALSASHLSDKESLDALAREQHGRLLPCENVGEDGVVNGGLATGLREGL